MKAAKPNPAVNVPMGENGSGKTDLTGIEGFFSFTLEYSNKSLIADSPSAELPASAVSADLPPFRQVLRDKTGLELEPRIVPVNVLIVDHVERIPTEN